MGPRRRVAARAFVSSEVRRDCRAAVGRVLIDAFSGGGGEFEVDGGGRDRSWKVVICDMGIMRYEPDGAWRFEVVIEVFWTGEMLRMSREVVGSAAYIVPSSVDCVGAEVLMRTLKSKSVTNQSLELK